MVILICFYNYQHINTINLYETQLKFTYKIDETFFKCVSILIVHNVLI